MLATLDFPLQTNEQDDDSQDRESNHCVTDALPHEDGLIVRNLRCAGNFRGDVKRIASCCFRNFARSIACNKFLTTHLVANQGITNDQQKLERNIHGKITTSY